MTPTEADVALVLASGLFDADWYLRLHPEAGGGSLAVVHYLSVGAAQGFDPGPGFSGQHYLLANPDVAAANMDPLLHYLHYGQAEGRRRHPVGAPLPVPPAPARDADLTAQEQVLIAASAVFDVDYYLDVYRDVSDSGADPLRHYLEYGADEGRFPNPFFDTRYYQARHMAPGDSANPLAHYLASPRRAQVDTSARFDGRQYLARYPDAATSELSPLDHFLRIGLPEGRSAVLPSPGAFANARTVDVSKVRCTVLVPVHNAADAVAGCLQALLRHTRFGAMDSLLVIDDASTDPRVEEVLRGLATLPGVRVLRQAENRGYTGTINRGIGLAGADDIVLLNSDTVVGPHWLRRLKATAWGDPRVGTVTAVSNAAGEFSVPAAGNQVPPAGGDADTLARAVEDAGAAPFEVPTGNGFCLYVRRALFEAVGTFDERAFPVGYGEENDFCMRAGAAGWVNLVDPTVYVQHLRSASFGERRDALAEAGFQRVCARHPDYEGAIRSIGESPGFVDARYRISRQFRRLAGGGYRPRPRILYVISTRVGGTPQTNADLMQAIEADFETYALASDGRVLELLRAGTDGYEVVERFSLSEPLRYASHGSLEYDLTVRALMQRLGIDLLHVRHLAWHGLGLVEVARSLDIPVLMSFHDYYCVCPTVNLLDETGIFHPRGVAEQAPNPLWHQDPTALPMTPARLALWQQRMQRALEGVSAFVTTSPAARRLICEALPGIAARSGDFHVIPHGRDFERFLPTTAAVPAGPGRPLRVLLPGNLSAHKGARLVQALKERDDEGRFELHVLGDCPPGLEGLVVQHGTYARGEFMDRVAGIAPDLAAVLSVWPETFCHTLTECWASGLPVVGVDIGAVGERIREHGAGWLLGFPTDADAVRDLLLRLATDVADRQARLDEVARWQNGSGRDADTSRMADGYRQLYRHHLARN